MSLKKLKNYSTHLTHSTRSTHSANATKCINAPQDSSTPIKDGFRKVTVSSGPNHVNHFSRSPASHSDDDDDNDDESIYQNSQVDVTEEIIAPENMRARAQRNRNFVSEDIVTPTVEHQYSGDRTFGEVYKYDTEQSFVSEDIIIPMEEQHYDGDRTFEEVYGGTQNTKNRRTGVKNSPKLQKGQEIHFHGQIPDSYQTEEYQQSMPPEIYIEEPSPQKKLGKVHVFVPASKTSDDDSSVDGFNRHKNSQHQILFKKNNSEEARRIHSNQRNQHPHHMQSKWHGSETSSDNLENEKPVRVVVSPTPQRKAKHIKDLPISIEIDTNLKEPNKYTVLVSPTSPHHVQENKYAHGNYNHEYYATEHHSDLEYMDVKEQRIKSRDIYLQQEQHQEKLRTERQRELEMARQKRIEFERQQVLLEKQQRELYEHQQQEKQRMQMQQQIKLIKQKREEYEQQQQDLEMQQYQLNLQKAKMKQEQEEFEKRKQEEIRRKVREEHKQMKQAEFDRQKRAEFERKQKDETERRLKDQYQRELKAFQEERRMEIENQEKLAYERKKRAEQLRMEETEKEQEIKLNDLRRMELKRIQELQKLNAKKVETHYSKTEKTTTANHVMSEKLKRKVSKAADSHPVSSNQFKAIDIAGMFPRHLKRANRDDGPPTSTRSATNTPNMSANRKYVHSGSTLDDRMINRGRANSLTSSSETTSISSRRFSNPNSILRRTEIDNHERTRNRSKSTEPLPQHKIMEKRMGRKFSEGSADVNQQLLSYASKVVRVNQNSLSNQQTSQSGTIIRRNRSHSAGDVKLKGKSTKEDYYEPEDVQPFRAPQQPFQYPTTTPVQYNISPGHIPLQYSKSLKEDYKKQQYEKGEMGQYSDSKYYEIREQNQSFQSTKNKNKLQTREVSQNPSIQNYSHDKKSSDNYENVKVQARGGKIVLSMETSDMESHKTKDVTKNNAYKAVSMKENCSYENRYFSENNSQNEILSKNVYRSVNGDINTKAKQVGNSANQYNAEKSKNYNQRRSKLEEKRKHYSNFNLSQAHDELDFRSIYHSAKDVSRFNKTKLQLVREGDTRIPADYVYYTVCTRYFNPETNDMISNIHRSGRVLVPRDVNHHQKCVFWHELYNPDYEEINVTKVVPRTEANINSMQFSLGSDGEETWTQSHEKVLYGSYKSEKVSPRKVFTQYDTLLDDFTDSNLDASSEGSQMCYPNTPTKF